MKTTHRQAWKLVLDHPAACPPGHAQAKETEMSKERDDRYFADGYREGKAGAGHEPPHSDPITTFGGLLLSDRERQDQRNYDKGYNAGRKSSK
jgi:hypothetical protein